MKKYAGLRVPSDPLSCVDLEKSSSSDGEEEEEKADEIVGSMPVLMIDLVRSGLVVAAPDDQTKIAGLGTLTLYEDDIVVDRVQAYAQLYPISDATKVNLLEHIAFKIK